MVIGGLHIPLWYDMLGSFFLTTVNDSKKGKKKNPSCLSFQAISLNASRWYWLRSRESQWSDFKHTEEEDCCNGWVTSDGKNFWMSSRFLTWATRIENRSCFPEMITFVQIECFSVRGSTEHLIWDAWHAVGYESSAEGTVPLKSNIQKCLPSPSIHGMKEQSNRETQTV